MICVGCATIFASKQAEVMWREAAEAFEAWFDREKSIRLQSKIHSREVWFAACAWQRERDATIAEQWNDVHMVNTCNVGKEIAVAIRNQS